MKESLSVRFLYSTALGRMLLKCLVRPEVSALAGGFLDSRLSTWLIPLFSKKNKIDMTDVIVPEQGFRSFNEFFSRKRKRALPDAKKSELISPCDGYLSCLPIEDGMVLDVKHTQFTIGDLLEDEKLAKKFKDGYALVFRLTPAHYHRYCYVADGVVRRNRRIPGVLHCVRPIVTRQIPVYVQNAREYQVLQTDGFGYVVQMEVGALMVGKITNHKREDRTRKSGEEKGYFEFGGSTIILLVERNAIDLREELLCGQNEHGETAVSLGMVIADKKE